MMCHWFKLHLPVEEVEHSQILRLSSDQNASTDARLRLAFRLNWRSRAYRLKHFTFRAWGSIQNLQSLSSSTPSAISIDAFGSAFAIVVFKPGWGVEAFNDINAN